MLNLYQDLAKLRWEDAVYAWFAGFTGYGSGDSIPDFQPPESPSAQLPLGQGQLRRHSRAESAVSSQGTHQAGGLQRTSAQASQSNLAGSMLARFFGSSVSATMRQGSPAPSTAALPPQDSAASGFSGRMSGLHNWHIPNGSVDGVAKQRGQTSRRRLWILPLASSSSMTDAASVTGVPARLGHFLVVSPPFVVAVDALGQPDPRHAMLDIAASFRGTHLEGSSLMMLDAAVLADKLVIATQSWLLMYAPASSYSIVVAWDTYHHIWLGFTSDLLVTIVGIVKELYCLPFVLCNVVSKQGITTKCHLCT